MDGCLSSPTTIIFRNSNVLYVVWTWHANSVFHNNMEDVYSQSIAAVDVAEIHAKDASCCSHSCGSFVEMLRTRVMYLRIIFCHLIRVPCDCQDSWRCLKWPPHEQVLQQLKSGTELAGFLFLFSYNLCAKLPSCKSAALAAMCVGRWRRPFWRPSNQLALVRKVS